MATSLADQLQKLAVPQTSLLKNDKKKSSLLFDPKEAAGIRKETFYQIGLEGFEELVEKNEVFESFRHSLFSPAAKSFDRVVEDKQANEKLDKSIERFLLRLSPYFLLPCTHKVLEFLVDRFMIHQFNRNYLILLGLPYHESNIFVRVIQICEFREESDPLYFLKSLQKPGVHLTRQTLLVHAANHSAFLKYVAQIIIKLAEIHEKPGLLTVAFNFYNVVFCGAIEYCSEVTEDKITQMVPVLLAGLKSSIPDFTASCYIIIAHLASKVTLTDKLLNRLVELISEVKCSSLKLEAVLALVILYQSQEQYTEMPKKAVVNLSKQDWLPKSLSILNESGSNVDAFLKILIQKVVEIEVQSQTKIENNFLINYLNEVKMDGAFVSVFLRSFLDGINSNMSTFKIEVRTWLKDILTVIEKQYPAQFDLEINNILNAKPDKLTHKRKICLQQILKYSTKTKNHSDIFYKLYHPSEEIRKDGVRQLSKYYQNLNTNDQDLLAGALIDKLNDDNPNIVLEALKSIKKIKYPQDKLFDGLGKVIHKNDPRNSVSKECLEIALELMCSKTEFSWDIFLEVFSFLLPGSTEEIIFAKVLLKQPFFAQSDDKELRSLHHALISLKISEKNLDNFTQKVFAYVSNKNDIEVKQLIHLINTNEDKFMKTSVQYCALLILTEALQSSQNFELIVAVLELYNRFYDATNANFEKKLSESEYLKISKRQILPAYVFLKRILKLVKSTNSSNVDFSKNSFQSNYWKLLLLIFFKDFDHSKEIIKEFMEISFDKLDRKIDLLLNASNFQFNSKYIFSFLTFVMDELVLQKDFPNICVSLQEQTIPCLITLLLSGEKNIRQIAIKIIKAFKKNTAHADVEWIDFLQGVLEHKKELIMDHNQATLVLSKLLQNKKNSNAKSIFVHFVMVKEKPRYVQNQMMYILAHIEDYELVNILSKALQDTLQESEKCVTGYSFLACEKTIRSITGTVIQSITKDSHVYTFLEKCLEGDDIKVTSHNETTNLRKILLSHYTNKDVLSNFSDDILQTILDDLCKIYVESNDPDCVSLVNKIYKHIDLDANLIIQLFEKMRDVQTFKESTNKNIRRQRKAIPTSDILDTLDWNKGVSVLELIQNKKKIKNSEILVPVIFDILKKCLEFDEQSAVEYPKQLILSTILMIGKKVENLSEKWFDVESIVQCVRSSQNPQTHHHAMLVLSYIAKLVPDKVLQHIMAIFTFVGSSLLRHDDAYSTQVISQILDTTVPIFLKDDHKDKLVKVLSVFVDALLDVPEHRRIALYKQLLNNMNPFDNMYLFLLLVFDSYVLSSKQKTGKGSELSKRLDIARVLCQEFDPKVTLNSCINIIEFLKAFPVEADDMKSFKNKELLSFNNYTPKQARHYRYTATTFIVSLLTAEHFVNQIATLNENDLFSLEKYFKDLIISVLISIQNTSKVSDSSRNSPQSQYWKVILHHTYDILDAVNALLPANMFLLVTKGLLVHSLFTVKRRALDLLNAKLHNNINLFDSCDKNEVYVLIPQILGIIELIQKENLDLEQEVLIQTALLSLKLFVKSFAQKDPHKFIEILKVITNLLNADITQNNIVASLILCLAELCVDLKAHAVSCLPDFMPAFLKILKKQKHQESSNLLMLSVITAIHKFMDSLPLFLSPYLGKILFETSILMSKFSLETKDQKMAAFLNKMSNLKFKIGATIPLRILVPSVLTSYENLIKKKAFKSVCPLMNILIEAIKNSTQNDITTSLPELSNFFLKALEFRSEQLTNIEVTNEVEKGLIKALTSLILKLSENIFRPFFYKLYDWAIRSTKQKSERVITFYNIAQEFANALKGLFVLFAGEFLKNSVDLLDSLNITKNNETYFNNDEKDVLLLDYVLSTLNAIFEYDNQKFINKDRFDLVMQPLVDQLENNLGSLTERNRKLLTPTILHFTLATAEDSLWKQMNYQILLKMRSTVPEIRLVTLHCLTEIVTKLGEDFLPLLPETIPFLAELLEDEDEKVEQACRKAVQAMEKVLGEPLQKYF